jgi:hypothetical protein
LLVRSNHNNGPIRKKVLELDSAVGETSEDWWH